MIGEEIKKMDLTSDLEKRSCAVYYQAPTDARSLRGGASRLLRLTGISAGSSASLPLLLTLCILQT